MTASRAGASASDIAWCKTHYATMRGGGVWAVPRSGLVFRKRDGGLELVQRMPFSVLEEVPSSVLERGALDLPGSEAELRAYQDADFETIRGRFEAAGIMVRSALDVERKTLDRLERIRRAAWAEGALGTPGLDSNIAETRRAIAKLQRDLGESS